RNGYLLGADLPAQRGRRSRRAPPPQEFVRCARRTARRVQHDAAWARPAVGDTAWAVEAALAPTAARADPLRRPARWQSIYLASKDFIMSLRNGHRYSLPLLAFLDNPLAQGAQTGSASCFADSARLGRGVAACRSGAPGRQAYRRVVCRPAHRTTPVRRDSAVRTAIADSTATRLGNPAL